MKITQTELKNIIRKNIFSEIKRTTSLRNSSINYDEFVNWAKREADKITSNIEEHNGLNFQWAEKAGEVKLIIYINSNHPSLKDETKNNDYQNAIGYVGLSKFKDGYKITTLGVKPSSQGAGIATKAYDYILSKTKLYSDLMQTPEARKLWVKLSKLYNVKAINLKSRDVFDVNPNLDQSELEITDLNNVYLYSNTKNNFILVATKK